MRLRNTVSVNDKSVDDRGVSTIGVDLDVLTVAGCAEPVNRWMC